MLVLRHEEIPRGFLLIIQDDKGVYYVQRYVRVDNPEQPGEVKLYSASRCTGILEATNFFNIVRNEVKTTYGVTH